MGDSDAVGAPAGVSGTERKARWPRPVGVVGMVIGAIMTYSKVMDLARLPRVPRLLAGPRRHSCRVRNLVFRGRLAN